MSGKVRPWMLRELIDHVEALHAHEPDDEHPYDPTETDDAARYDLTMRTLSGRVNLLDPKHTARVEALVERHPQDAPGRSPRACGSTSHRNLHAQAGHRDATEHEPAATTQPWRDCPAAPSAAICSTGSMAQRRGCATPARPRELAGCGSVTVATIHAALKKDPGAREAIARVKATATQRRQTGPEMTGR